MSFLSNFIPTAEPSLNKLLEDAADVVDRPNTETFAERLSKLKSAVFEHEAPNVQAAATSELLITKHRAFFMKLLVNMKQILFEGRKDVAALFNFLLSNDECSGDATQSFAFYVNEHFDEMFKVFFDYIRSGEMIPDIALLCGSMIRSIIRHKILYERVLSCPDLCIYPYLDEFVHLPNFDIASDAFNTLQEIFRLNAQMVARLFLEKNGVYDTFVPKYNSMLMSKNYLTKRLSIKLLSDMLLDRSNYNTMLKYIGSQKNLMISMLLLRDVSGNIQLESFHVFKIFVANPSKPKEISEILRNNKIKLVAYLSNFHNELDESDARFRDEKSLLIQTLNTLSDS